MCALQSQAQLLTSRFVLLIAINSGITILHALSNYSNITKCNLSILKNVSYLFKRWYYWKTSQILLPANILYFLYLHIIGRSKVCPCSSKTSETRYLQSAGLQDTLRIQYWWTKSQYRIQRVNLDNSRNHCKYGASSNMHNENLQLERTRYFSSGNRGLIDA